MTWRRILPCALAGSVLYLRQCAAAARSRHPAVLCPVISYPSVRVTSACLPPVSGPDDCLSGRLPTTRSMSRTRASNRKPAFIENEYSVNLATSYYYRKQWRPGWINVVNPSLGEHSSGHSRLRAKLRRSQSVYQQIEKGFRHVRLRLQSFPTSRSLPITICADIGTAIKYSPNSTSSTSTTRAARIVAIPIAAKFMTDISDAYESAYTIMLNLNKTWIEKRAISSLIRRLSCFAAIIWFLKIYKDGRYCTFPHAIELLNKRYWTCSSSLRPIRRWRTTSCPLWTPGSPAPKTSCRVRSLRPRYLFHVSSRRYCTGS